MRISRTRLLPILLLIVFLTFPTLAYAMNYGVAGGDYFTQTNSHGTYGYNRVFNPTVTSGHVSSFYVYDSTNNGYNHAEVGWVKLSGWSGPKFFAAWTDQGIYNDVFFQNASTGDHNYKVVNILNTNYFQFYVDGALKYTYNFANYRQGTSLCSSERNNLGDDNWSHFWDLQQLGSDGNWWQWSNLQQFMDNDPSYNLNVNSNTECYVSL